MKPNEFLDEIKNIISPSTYFKPHKYLALLAILDIIAADIKPANQFKFDERFKRQFTKYFTLYHGPDDRDRPLAPFFHLKTSGNFWHLKPLEGKENELAKLTTVGSPRELYSCIDYGYLDDELFEYLCKSEIRDKAIQVIKECLQLGLGQTRRDSMLDNPQDSGRKITSLFEHEATAIQSITNSIVKYNIGVALSNLLIYDNQTNDYYECDLIIIAPQGIYLVELKHWSGKIRIAPYNWIKDDVVYRQDPHRANLFKAKILKGIYQHQFRTFPDIWVESVVVLTNPEAEVEGASSLKTEKHCPSFGSIDTFIDFLKHQRRAKEEKLDHLKIERVGHYLESLQHSKREKGHVFPGFEIIERLTERPDLVEYVVRPKEGKIRRSQRFRVFLPPQGSNVHEKERFLARARNTLDAIAKIGDYPNILKVWPVPDETGLIIEGSDWSEQGTLRDLLNDLEGPLPIEDALGICQELLDALTVVHKADIIHRAIKPENILMANGRPKLMNFDLAYQLEIGEHVTVIPDLMKLKRDAYTAPEVYHGSDIDERTDLFSVGVILFELLTHSLPFKISTELEITNGRMTEAALQKLKERDISTEILEVLDSLVILDQNQRIQNAEKTREALGLKPKSQVGPEERGLNRKFDPGEEYDVFTVERLLAEGPISQVYLARTVGNDSVALKVFNNDIPLVRIQNEETVTSAVYSPYLVHAKRIGHWKKERFFLELNYIDGRVMRDFIKCQERPDINEFKQVASSLLQGLYALHERKIDGKASPLLHCDIKPDNIIVTQDGSAVLIDFGIAGPPRIDQFQGTAQYIAPDLLRGGDIKFSENGDLYALGVTLFEWLYGIHPSEIRTEGFQNIEDIRDDVPDTLRGWMLKAISTTAEERFQNVEWMQRELMEAVQESSAMDEQEASTDPNLLFIEPEKVPPTEPVVSLPQPDELGNPFVAYLNSLHNASGANENALAESQARNPNFCHIQVPLPVTDYIFDRLTDQNGSHVILTGNAGDGKSTICLEIFKRFNGIPFDQPLASDMKAKEMVRYKGVSITLIKDMSELTEQDRHDLLEKVCSNDQRYLIVSNTGSLLNAFEGLARDRTEWFTLQSDLLGALDSVEPKDITCREESFHIINIGRVDSIDTTIKVFEKMLAGERWQKCDNLECRDKCPIYVNVRMLCASKSVALKGIELFYRRLYEYGYRLTIRQMTEHLAYAITAGLDYYSIQEISSLALRPPLRYYLFFNRFFGDCGDEEDITSNQINAVRFARTLESGSRPNPGLDRMLWIEESSQPVSFADTTLNEIYLYLRNAGRGIKNDNLQPSLARLQVRRLIYFYGAFQDADLGKQFVSTFLDSPLLETYVEWQKTGKIRSQLELRRLRRGIIHILQEHFTGLRLPETAGDQETLFITLNRRNYDIRQTAQIVLAKISADEFQLYLKPVDLRIGITQHRPFLSRKDCGIDLDLPFLDYVHSRHQGEIAQQLKTFYIDRLEKFKLALLESTTDKSRGDMMLVRLQLNHQFKSQSFNINEGILEVTN
ncbi:MAG: Serine/threonine-protein kinase StkP [Deltaproteobacteria bacterium ADurb.Bin135]|nr:MAG: Serine/threonine-protein kinase StkP [Deltaproteobacteria bacterium ADurb.Bin135]